MYVIGLSLMLFYNEVLQIHVRQEGFHFMFLCWMVLLNKFMRIWNHVQKINMLTSKGSAYFVFKKNGISLRGKFYPLRTNILPLYLINLWTTILPPSLIDLETNIFPLSLVNYWIVANYTSTFTI